LAEDGVKFKRCARCISDEMADPAVFCSAACLEASWKFGGHKQYHKEMKKAKEQRGDDAKTCAEVERAKAQLGLDGSKDLSDDFDCLNAKGQVERVRGNHYTASRILRKAIRLRPLEPVGYLCAADNAVLGGNPLNACRLYDCAAQLFEMKEDEQLWAYAMLLAYDARKQSTPCKNIFCTGRHFGQECCRVERLAPLFPSWISGQHPHEYIQVASRIIATKRPRDESPETHMKTMDEINRYWMLLAESTNFQQYGTCFVSGGKPEYPSAEAKARAKKVGFPVYAECQNPICGTSQAKRRSPSHSSHMYKWAFGESEDMDDDDSFICRVDLGSGVASVEAAFART
jgi:hypothetical protein